MRHRCRGLISIAAAAAFLVAGEGVTEAAPRGKAPKKALVRDAKTAPEGAAAAKQGDEIATPEKDKDKEPATSADLPESSAKAKTAPDDPPKEAVPGTEPAGATRPTEESGPGSKPEIKPNPETLALGAPTSDDEASPEGGALKVHPYFLVAGGLKYDFVKEKPGETRNNRASTYALARFGFKARWLDFVSAESEFMAAGGVSLHGTSAYEGQAALQVRQQIVRLTKYGFKLEVGRVIDEASVDYFSAHVSETFIQDTATRDALLFSGFNLGTASARRTRSSPAFAPASRSTQATRSRTLRASWSAVSFPRSSASTPSRTSR
jgi:hypothetical protein